MNVKLQPKYIEVYYWLFSLQRLVTINKNEPFKAKFRELC